MEVLPNKPTEIQKQHTGDPVKNVQKKNLFSEQKTKNNGQNENICKNTSQPTNIYKDEQQT